MIGNSLRSDIRRAQNAGMTAVWLNRKNGPDDSVVPDLEVHDSEGVP